MLLVEPQNTAHVIGQATPLFFNCSIDNIQLAADLFIWYEFITNTVIGRYIASSLPGSTTPVQVVDGLESEYDSERSNLIVKDANFDDAGTYQCTTGLSSRAQRRVEAVILSKFVNQRTEITLQFVDEVAFDAL